MALKVEHLLSHGISARAIELWRTHYSDTLLPLQEMAIMDYGYLQGKSLMVFAPTSSGKTFIAETAAAKKLENKHKVVYLVPTKALAEEKYRIFNRLYGEMGFRILVATRERRETDELALRGNFDLLIAVYEKMKSYLVSRPELLGQIGLVVVDEVQTLGDRKRGDVVELLLTKIIASPYHPQIIGLSAVLGNAEQIAKWLGCDLLNFLKRPVELREGVFNVEDNKFYYICFNSGKEGVEPLYQGESGLIGDENSFYMEAILALAAYLAEGKSEQVLIFVPTRAMTRRWAQQLAQMVNLPGSQEAIKEIQYFEQNYSQQILKQCLEKGVGFHNADLTWDLRNLIENHYDKGNIRLLVSTSTLGQGVNLTGRNVICVQQMVGTDEWTEGYSFVPLSRQLFRNQGGRGGRYTKEADFGRSIMVAKNKAEVDRLMKYYIHSKLEPVTPPIAHKDVAPYILDLVASNICRTEGELKEVFQKTYSGVIGRNAMEIPRHRDWQQEETIHGLIQRAIRNCHKKNLIEIDEDARLKATGLGEVAATKGILPNTALRFYSWLKWLNAATVIVPLEVFLVIAFTPDAEEFPIGLSYRERVKAQYLRELTNRLSAEILERNQWLKRWLTQESGVTENELRAIKKALVLEQWIGAKDTREIEEAFGVYAGTINNLSLHFNWLAQTLAHCARTLGINKDLVPQLDTIAERLVYGVEEEGLKLSRLRIEGFSRTYIQRLLHEGFDSLQALSQADLAVLESLIPRHIATNLIEESKRLLSIKPVEKLPIHNKKGALKPAKPILIIDAKSPGVVSFYGCELQLTRLPYQLLLLLATRAGKLVSYEQIDEQLWPEAKVERQQISAHRRYIIRAFTEVVGKEEAEKLLETRSALGLVLKLSKEEVRIS